MTQHHLPKGLLMAATLLLLVTMAGCLQMMEGPDERVEAGDPSDTSEGASSDAVDERNGTDDDGEGERTAVSASDGDGSDGDGSDGSLSGGNDPDASQPYGNDSNEGATAIEEGGSDDGSDIEPPASIDDRAVERAVWRRIDAHRDTVGVRDAEWSQGLGVEPGRAANEALVERGATPPSLATGRAFAASSEALLKRFREEGRTSCTGLSKDIAGQVSAVVDIRPHSDAANPQDAATTAERVAHHVIREWRDDPETATVIEGSYRYVGVDALYDDETGSLYITAALC